MKNALPSRHKVECFPFLMPENGIMLMMNSKRASQVEACRRDRLESMNPREGLLGMLVVILLLLLAIVLRSL
jgi:hypothetical protein